MRCVERWRTRAAAALAALFLAACGGGTTTETTLTGTSDVTLDTPTGPNTTEIVVDSGPGFSLGAANIPYVTITLCAPGSASNCVTIDHVFLDTGSMGLRVFKSTVAALSLPDVTIPADAATNTPAGRAVECYPFVLGAVWGPVVHADLRIAGEVALSLPIQLIDDGATPAYTPTANCLNAATPALLSSVSALQANGVLGVGMVAYDCGLGCVLGDYSRGVTQYYSCTSASACSPAAAPIGTQVQNPVTFFATNNNGTVIHMPAVPESGAHIAKGRLVFGIGTQTNNQPPPQPWLYVDNVPAHSSYLSFTTTMGGLTFPDSYIDSGSNGLFFDDTTIPGGCKSSSGANGGWFCPTSTVRRSATVTDMLATSVQVDFAIGNADSLFGTSNNAFATLGGTVGQGSSSFVWGFPLFYGRAVFTSIWGQALSPSGPWNAF